MVSLFCEIKQSDAILRQILRGRERNDQLESNDNSLSVTRIWKIINKYFIFRKKSGIITIDISVVTDTMYTTVWEHVSLLMSGMNMRLVSDYFVSFLLTETDGKQLVL